MPKMATVSSKGRITLPLSIRKRLGLRKGSRIVFLEGGDEVRVIREADLDSVFEVFERRGKDLRLTRKRLRDLMKEAKARLWKEHDTHRREE